jgi:hypothetical protein
MLSLKLKQRRTRSQIEADEKKKIDDSMSLVAGKELQKKVTDLERMRNEQEKVIGQLQAEMKKFKLDPSQKPVPMVIEQPKMLSKP